MTASSSAENRGPEGMPRTWAEELAALLPGRFRSRSPRGPASLIAVGSGKGGVGKTVVSSSLAIALAEEGRGRVLALDLDLGGANLHNGLGVARPDFALNRFILEGRGLEELVADSGTPGLGLVAGASDVVGLSELREADQRRFLDELSALRADVTIVDLGAGSSLFNLDLFRRADHGVLVTTPEPTAVQNAYGFLRAAIYRRIRSAFRGEEALHEIIENAMNHRSPEDISSVPALVREIARYNRPAASRLEHILSETSFGLVVNMAEARTAEQIADRFSTTVRRHLGVAIDFLGGVASDPAVSRAICDWRPLVTHEPGAPAGRDLRAIAARLSRRMSAAVSDGVRVGSG